MQHLNTYATCHVNTFFFRVDMQHSFGMALQFATFRAMVISMIKKPGSLKQKLVLTYAVILLLMFGIIMVNWYNLRNVEKMVVSGQIISDLFDTALEIRRFEKNYFLYNKEEEYQELSVYLNRAESLLDVNRTQFTLFTSNKIISELNANISEYRKDLEAIHNLRTTPIRFSLRAQLRDLGRQIVDSTEKISRTERKTMQGTLQSARRALIESIILFTIASIIGGIVFYSRLIRMLRILEGHMNKVAQGEFSPMPVEFNDRELVSLNRAFNRMLHELEERKTYMVQSEKLASMGTLLFGVAHELNNPLSNISISCQILKEEIKEDNKEFNMELLDQIDEETDRTKNIVSSLLDYSKKREKENINLKRAVDETTRFIKGEVPTKIELSVSIPEDITLFVDKQRLQQALLNLIKNGIDAIGEQGKVSVSAHYIKNKESVVIEISDTGPGMDSEMVSNIFDPFFTTKASSKGYGLGLFIVHSMIEEHKGSIMVDSEPGFGTVFTIELPTNKVRG